MSKKLHSACGLQIVNININRLFKKMEEVEQEFAGAVAQWFSQRTSVLEVAGSIPAPVIVEFL